MPEHHNAQLWVITSSGAQLLVSGVKVAQVDSNGLLKLLGDIQTNQSI